MTVPKGYKLTEVGVIPDDWDIVPLQAVCKVNQGLQIPIEKRLSHPTSKSRPYITIQAINSRKLTEYIDTYSFSVCCEEHDVLMTRTGNTGIVVTGVCGVFHNNFFKINFDRTKLDKDFFVYYLRTNKTQKIILEKAGTSTIPDLNHNDFYSIEIALPSLPKQKAIAEVLSDTDALLESLDRLIAKKRNLKQATMQKLLTGKTRLPGFSGEWEVKRLGDVVDSDPENLGGDTRPDFAFNYIALEDVDRGFLRNYTSQIFANAPSRARRRLQINDVLISTVRPNLQSHLLFKEKSGNWICSTGFCVIRCREGLTHPGYVFFHFFAGYINRQIEALLTGSNYPAINSADVRALSIPIPGIEEQKAIAAILSDMDAEIAALEQRRDKTRLLKQGMMQELLTGKTRLI